jgi:nucleotide-binding universal stress UspA family protein
MTAVTSRAAPWRERARELALALDARVVVTDVTPVHASPQTGDVAMRPGNPLLAAPSTVRPVSESVTGPTGDPIAPEQGAWEQQLEHARAFLEEGGVECELTAPIGPPIDELLHVADEHDADLIVVGARERGFVERLLRRSVGEEVARRAKCDVLLCHRGPRA